MNEGKQLNRLQSVKKICVKYVDEPVRINELEGGTYNRT